MAKVLLIDDDLELVEMLKEYLDIARRTIDARRGTIRASNLGSGGSRVDISPPSGARH